MPYGEFLENFPAGLFVSIHVVMLFVGLWAIMRSSRAKAAIAAPLWLYVASQPLFLLFWAGAITLKLTAVAEQTLMVVMVVWLALRTSSVDAVAKPGDEQQARP